MPADSLLTHLLEELVKTAKEAELALRLFIKALFVLTWVLLSKAVSNTLRLLVYPPKLKNKDAYSKKQKIHSSPKVMTSSPWGTPYIG